MILVGYPPSVFTRSARLGLHLCGLRHGLEEFDPFDGSEGPHPFGRVPILRDGGLSIYETQAILTYLDRLSGGILMPDDPISAAREMQVASIASAYAYWPLVRQVYAARVFGPANGEAPDEARVAEGLAAAPQVLDALEDIAAEGHALTGPHLGGLILAPMLDAFSQDRDGARLLQDRPALHAWLDGIRAHDCWEGTATWP